jgi:hypothetical protein
MTERSWTSKLNTLIRNLLKEYSLEVDDIRWLISTRLCEEILSDYEESVEITRKIWSGKLESSLYNMEEKYLEDISSQLGRGLIDEAWIREQFAEASELKCRRF